MLDARLQSAHLGARPGRTRSPVLSRQRAHCKAKYFVCQGAYLELSRCPGPPPYTVNDGLSTGQDQLSSLFPKLRPRTPGVDSGDVARHQRSRLIGALVVAVSEKGYEAVTVARTGRHGRGLEDRVLPAVRQQGGLLPRRLRRDRRAGSGPDRSGVPHRQGLPRGHGSRVREIRRDRHRAAGDSPPGLRRLPERRRRRCSPSRANRLPIRSDDPDRASPPRAFPARSRRWSSVRSPAA